MMVKYIKSLCLYSILLSMYTLPLIVLSFLVGITMSDTIREPLVIELLKIEKSIIESYREVVVYHD